MTGTAALLHTSSAMLDVKTDTLALAFARGFSPAETDQNLQPLADRLSRLAPSSLSQAERITRLEAELALWSHEIFGRTLRLSALKTAIISSKAPLDIVLGSPETVAPWKAALEAALPMAYPVEVPKVMPEQSFASMKSVAFLSRVFSLSFFRKPSKQVVLRSV